MMEQVRSILFRQHRPFFRMILRSIRDAGYFVSFKVLCTHQHGVPQRRRRAYVVGICKDSVRHTFKWPERAKLKSSARHLLGPIPLGANPKALPSKDKPRERNLVKLAYAKCLLKGIDPRKQLVVTDVDCSLSRHTHAVNMMCTMTATRCARKGWWMSLLGGRCNLEHIFRFQGLEESVDIPTWRDTAGGLSENMMGHMVGNSLSLNVAERVLRRLLYSSGLVRMIPPDRWALSQ